MAVEILFLSGARRNERIVLEGRTFRAGSERDCEVFFDPERDTPVRGRSAKFCLQDGGWYVHCTGGEMYVNRNRVTGATHLRSGDKIRMSDSGPEFSFQIVAAVKSSPAAAPGNVAASPLPLGTGPGVRVATSSDSAPAEGNGLSLAAASPLPARPQAPSEEPRRNDVKERHPAFWFAGGLAATLVALVVFRFVTSSPVVDKTVPEHPIATAGAGQTTRGAGNTTPNAPAVPPTVSVENPTVTANKGCVAENVGSYQGDEPVEITAFPGTVKQNSEQRTWTWSYTPPDGPTTETVRITAKNGRGTKTTEFALVVEDPVRKKLQKAVFLVLMATAHDYCTFATAVAIDKHTLLITAREAMGLVQVRDSPRSKDKGFKVWVAQPPVRALPGGKDEVQFAFQAEVKEIRVLAPYVSLTEASPNYFDLNIGLLTVKDSLPEDAIAPVASPDELREVGRGSQLLCFGFYADCNLVNDKDKKKYEPQLAKAVVSWRFPGQLMNIEAEMFKNASGSPVVNEAGKIIGLYAAPKPDDKDKNLHIVTLLSLESIDAWLQKTAQATIWVPATPIPTSAKDQPPSQP
jgi:hypothetical protein